MNKLLKFYSPTCNPCKFLSNYLEDRGAEYTDIDITEDKDAIEKYDLTSVPTLILLDENEQEIDRVIGFNPERTDQLIVKL